jgi:hypothetical protein
MKRYGLRDDQFARIERLLRAVPARLAAAASLHLPVRQCELGLDQTQLMLRFQTIRETPVSSGLQQT